jgi:aspartate beta-hydroxylase
MSANEATVATLKDEADRALRRGDVAAAAIAFERAAALAPERADLLMGLAASHRAQGRLEAALAATERALAIQPRLFNALLFKGVVLDDLGRLKAAAPAYVDALRMAPPSNAMAEPTRRALARGREVCERHQAEMIERLREAAGPAGLAPSLSRKIEAFIETTAGRRRFYAQQPSQFYFPGLPAIEFYERDEFPWLAALEAHWQAARDEALAVWREGTDGLTPYVQLEAGTPLDQWAELNQSMNWSAFHLFQDGAPVAANQARCPATLAALEVLDQPAVRGRSPTALFSILRPGAHIPPHNGLNNTRLILHLALIAPEGCALRVGGETRVWREGEAFVFDDTIEHEAWNRSPAPRAVLICDVWNPRLSAEERDLIVRLTDVADRFNEIAPGSTVA